MPVVLSFEERLCRQPGKAAVFASLCSAVTPGVLNTRRVHGRWVQYGHLECLDRELSGMISSLWTAAGTVPNSLAAASSDLDAYLPPASYRARVWACRLLVVLWLILLSTMLFPLVSTSVCKPHVAVVFRGMHKTAGICTVEEARRSCS